MRQRKNEVWAASAGAVRHDHGEGAIPERKAVGVRTNRKPVPTRPEIYIHIAPSLTAPEEGEAHPCPSGIASASQRTSALIYGSPLISTENFFRVRNRPIRGHDSKTYRALWATAGIFRLVGTRKGRTAT
jgi:hypothetical protein